MHLAVAIREVGAQFHAVERGRARAGESRILGATPLLAQDILLAHGGSKERIAPQLAVVIEVLVTKRQAIKALAHQVAHRVFDPRLIAGIGETPRNQAADPESLIDLAQQEKSTSLLSGPPLKSATIFREPKS